jgi:hypothetical protein
METFSDVSGIWVGVANGVASGAGFSMTMAGVVMVNGSCVPIAVVGVRVIVSVDVGIAVGVCAGTEQALRATIAQDNTNNLDFISLP